MAVVQTIPITAPFQAVLHPDGRHLIVSCATGFKVFEIQNGSLALAKDYLIQGFPISLDISPKGDRLMAALVKAYGTLESAGVHVYSYHHETIQHECEVKVKDGLPGFKGAFALQFSPDGKRVLSLNGLGLGSKGSFDDVLSDKGGQDCVGAFSILSEQVSPRGRFGKGRSRIGMDCWNLSREHTAMI